MAAIQVQQSANEVSPARVFWDATMAKHPKFAGILAIVLSVLGFFFNGHLFVAFGHWVIKTSGRIAETVLLFATLWVTAINVAPDFMQKFVGADRATTFSSLALLAFSLLPEIIVFAAILITYEHWARFFHDRRWSNAAWLWGSLYTLPTGAFVTMTIITISSFVSHNGALSSPTGGYLVVRCLAAWFYALLGLLYASIGKKMDSTITQGKVQDLFTTLKTQFEDATAAVVENARKNIENTVSTQLATLPAFSQEQVQVQSDIAALNNQVSALVALIEEQQKTIQALSGSFHEVRRDWHMTVTEIRAFTQESPAIQAPAHAPMLTSGVTVEEDKEAQIKKYVLTGILDGHVPSIRDIAKRFHVGTSKAKEYKDSVLRERG